MQIIEHSDYYEIPVDGGVATVRKNVDGAWGDRLAALLADPATIIIPYAPAPPPTPSEARARQYRARLDDYARLVVLCQVLLEKIPDIPDNVAIRTKVTDRLAAAKTAILTAALEIETANPDAS